MEVSEVVSETSSERSFIQRMISYWDTTKRTLDLNLTVANSSSSMIERSRSNGDSIRSASPSENNILALPFNQYQDSYSATISMDDRDQLSPLPRAYIPLDTRFEWPNSSEPFSPITDFPELYHLCLWSTISPNSESLDVLEKELASFEFEDYVIIKKKGNRLLFLKSKAEEMLFDKITKWKFERPLAEMQEAIEVFKGYELHDAFIKILFVNDSCPWDSIIKYDRTAKMNLKLNILYKHLRGQLSSNDTFACIRGKHIQSLMKRNLVVELEYLDLEAKVRYLKIIAPFETLCEEAERMRLKMPVSKAYTEEIMQDIHNSRIGNGSLLQQLPYFNRLERYGKPRISVFFFKTSLHIFENGTMSWPELVLFFFSSAKRNQLCHSVVLHCSVRLESNTGQESTVDDMRDKNIYDAYYAVHDGSRHARASDEEETLDKKLFGMSRGDLYAKWKKELFKWGYDPSEEIKDYFGEEDGYFFKWVAFYSRWVKIAGIIGLLFFSYGVFQAILSDKDTMSRVYLLIDNNSIVYFGLFMNLWSILFLKFWKRHSNYLGFMWDTFHFSEVDPTIRAEWKPTRIRTSPVTWKSELYVPYSTRLYKKVMASFLMFVCFLIISAGIVGLIFLQSYLRQFFTDHDLANNSVFGILKNLNLKLSGVASSIAAAIFTVVQIILFRPFYRIIAEKLNDWQNYRTWQEYESGFITKSIIFSAVNNYGFLLYLTIVRPIIQYLHPDFKLFGIWNGTCSKNGCIADITISIFSIFFLRQLTRQIAEILRPILKRRWKSFKNRARYKSHDPPEYIKDGEMKRNSHSTVVLYYTNEVIQFGFIVMFSALNPLGPFIAWIFTRAQAKIDVWDRLRNLQRPFGKSVHSIGSWESILRMSVHLGIWTNAFIIAFVSNSFNDFFEQRIIQSGLFEFRTRFSTFIARLVFVVLYQQIAFVLLMLVDTIQDYPKIVRIGLQSEKYFELQRSRKTTDYELARPRSRAENSSQNNNAIPSS